MPEATKQRLTILAMMLATLPFFIAVNLPSVTGMNTSSLQSVALYFSAVSGYIGISLLIWQLILGTRTISGLFFDDLPDKLKLHHKLGMYGAIAILLHPLLLLVAYSEMPVYLFWPSNAGTFELSVTYGRIAFWSALLLWTSAVLLRRFIPYRFWRYGHILTSYTALILVILHVPEIGSSFKNDWVQFYWYIFVAIAIICIALRLRYLFGYGKVKYKVTNKQFLNDLVYVLTLQPQEKQLPIAAGQHIYLQMALLRESHPFTVLDYDSNTGKIRVAIKIFGRFTKKLSSVKTGQDLLIDGPYGVFLNSQSTSQPTIFIAGGIGITPFYQQSVGSDNQSIYLFFVNQNVKNVIFRDEFMRSLGSRYIEFFTQEDIKQKNTEYGRFSSKILSKYAPNAPNGQYYVCGPKGMMDAAKEQLIQYGVPRSNIHTEEFSF